MKSKAAPLSALLTKGQATQPEPLPDMPPATGEVLAVSPRALAPRTPASRRASAAAPAAAPAPVPAMLGPHLRSGMVSLNLRLQPETHALLTQVKYVTGAPIQAQIEDAIAAYADTLRRRVTAP